MSLEGISRKDWQSSKALMRGGSPSQRVVQIQRAPSQCFCLPLLLAGECFNADATVICCYQASAPSIFWCRLKTRNSPGIFQAFGAYWICSSVKLQELRGSWICLLLSYQSLSYKPFMYAFHQFCSSREPFLIPTIRKVRKSFLFNFSKILNKHKCTVSPNCCDPFDILPLW